MVEDRYQVVWTKRSLKHMREIFDYIQKDSPKNASKLVEDIALAVYKSAENPEIYAPDKFKIDNDGSYRAFERHRYRVSYRFSKDIIRVLRVRHTSMEPLEY